MTDAAVQAWIGTGWKMNKTLADAQQYLKVLLGAKDCANIQRFVIPPFTCIREVKKTLKTSNILVGAQNMHWKESGAWTGEISASMLTDCEMDIVELGHSERRAHFAETDKKIGLKVKTALKHNLMPLICIGETLDERESGQASQILEQQVRTALEHVSLPTGDSRILFAYEPVWAIGENGIPASADYANERQAEIKAITKELLGAAVPCLYGGSVTVDNCAELIACEYIDGLFIGRAALEIDTYLGILETCDRVLG